jgi:hypothetical protein
MMVDMIHPFSTPLFFLFQARFKCDFDKKDNRKPDKKIDRPIFTKIKHMTLLLTPCFDIE